MRHEDLLSTAVAARELGVTKRTVQRWIADGAMEALRVENGYQGQFLIDPAEVERIRAASAGSSSFEGQEVQA